MSTQRKSRKNNHILEPTALHMPGKRAILQVYITSADYKKLRGELYEKEE